MSFALQIQSILPTYAARFESYLETQKSSFGADTVLKEACLYSLGGAAKRFRPALVYMASEALSNNDVSASALAVECFHTSSLIADDLPCMDNDDFRRGRPTVHKVYGEANALLASFALIAKGFELIAQNATTSSGFEVLQEAVFAASRSMGISGLIGGQFLDLNPKDSTLETINEINDKKTVVLFDLSLTLGWLFGGGDKKRLPELHKAAFHFGSAFQIIDDIQDYDQDVKIQKINNFAITFGIDAAQKAVHDHAQLATKLFKALGLSGPLTDLSQAFLNAG